jgi:hypothetical protein
MEPMPEPSVIDSGKGITASGLGVLAAYALAMAGLSGKLSYDFFSGRNEQAIMEEAMRRRASQRSGGFLPQHVYLEDKKQYA